MYGVDRLFFPFVLFLADRILRIEFHFFSTLTDRVSRLRHRLHFKGGWGGRARANGLRAARGIVASPLPSYSTGPSGVLWVPPGRLLL